jgi:hypothetical protein
MSVDVNRLAAYRRAIMDETIIDNPRAHEAFEKFEYLMEHGRCKANRSMLCMYLFAVSQSGKSTLLETFAALKNSSILAEDKSIPVLIVTLHANTTRKGLAQTILMEIGEHGWETGPMRGTETILLQRVREFLKLTRTGLLVIDEAHELVNSDNDRMAYSVGETFKRMLIKGVCPIVLSGVEKGRSIFKNEQLLQRSIPAVELTPLSATSQSDLQLFIKFLADYLRAIEAKGVAGGATALIQGDIPACLLEVSQGVLGATCNLLKEAVRIMTYEGRSELERAHLAEATNTVFIQKGLYPRNPFLHGFAPLRAAA